MKHILFFNFIGNHTYENKSRIEFKGHAISVNIFLNNLWKNGTEGYVCSGEYDIIILLYNQFAVYKHDK